MVAKYGNLAFKAQIAFFRNKVDVPTAVWTDVWLGGHDTAFMVAGAARAELLDDLRTAVGKAIENGTTLAEFRKDFDALVERHGWTGWTGEGSARGRAWRTRVIYQTNLRTSYAAGRWQQLQAKKDFAPYLMYVHDDSVRFPRPHHVAWDGTVLHIDDPWWQAHYPPNGWGCKCKVRALTRGQLQRRGLEVGEPPDSPIDPKTGAPVGIDKGWAYAPGASIPQQLATHLRTKKLPLAIKRALLDDIDAVLAKRRAFDRTTPVAEAATAGELALHNAHVLDALATEYQGWVRDIVDGRLERAGGRRQVGAITPTVLDRLKALSIEPASAAITIEQREISHLVAEARKGGKALTRAMVDALPRHLAAPRAVIWDGSGRHPALLYVFDAQGDERMGRVAVRVNFERRGEQINAIRSGALVSNANLKQPGMVLLEGEL